MWEKNNIGDMSERSKRTQRKHWRKHQKALRKRRKDAEKEAEEALTPPQSPDFREDPPQLPSRQLSTSRKQRKRKTAKCFKENKQLKVKLKYAEKKPVCTKDGKEQSSLRQRKIFNLSQILRDQKPKEC